MKSAVKLTKCLVISSIVPQETVGGPRALHTLLSSPSSVAYSIVWHNTLPGFNVHLLRPTLQHRIVHKITRIRILRKISRLLLSITPKLYSYHDILKIASDANPDIILTVAHGSLWPYAQRIAAERSIPLIVILHDWWPDIIGLPRWIKYVYQQYYNSFLRCAETVFVLSEYASCSLPPSVRSQILATPPIVTQSLPNRTYTQRHQRNGRLIRYAGNLYENGQPILDLLQLTLEVSSVKFEVAGDYRHWPKKITRRLSLHKSLRSYVPNPEYITWLAESDFLLVTVSFAPNHKTQAAISFPSKIVNYISLGIPIIIWGPEYASCINWATETRAAFVFSSPSASRLLDFVLTLSEREILAVTSSAATLAKTDLSYANIVNKFESRLTAAAAGYSK